MTSIPQFPDFKPLAIEDRDFIHERLWAYQPCTSELTFTNLFIWREAYCLQWTVKDDWLLLFCRGETGDYCAFPPIVPANRAAVSRAVLEWLHEAQGVARPHIKRADSRLAAELAGAAGFVIEPTEEHFDYVYEREALATLAGRKYSAKRNHINGFVRDNPDHSYEPMTPENVKECITVAQIWCENRRCDDDMNLLEERAAVFEALRNFEALQLVGGVVRIEGLVQAFTLGELLNAETAVVHIEKADSEIRGLYPMINQQFVQQQWAAARYINREQDLGEEGLRRAKQSYYPAFMVEKYRISMDF